MFPENSPSIVVVTGTAVSDCGDKVELGVVFGGCTRLGFRASTFATLYFLHCSSTGPL